MEKGGPEKVKRCCGVSFECSDFGGVFALFDRKFCVVGNVNVDWCGMDTKELV